MNELDLTGNPKPAYDLLELAKKAKREINIATKNHFEEPDFRAHLGASVIGNDCNRATWYDWRWVKKEELDGRKYRLFNRGHTEEDRNTKWLELAGFTILSHQERIKFGFGDHGGGSSDKVVVLPEKFGLGDMRVLVEEKTHNQKSYDKIIQKSGKVISIKEAKPQHWIQANIYAHKLDIDLIMYMPVCKNDDAIDPQFHMVDHEYARNTIRRADDIILSQIPPPRAFNSETHFHCKHFCTHTATCWNAAGAMNKNCRSCKYAKPGLEKTWQCTLHNVIIPKEHIAHGCGNWEDITRI